MSIAYSLKRVEKLKLELDYLRPLKSEIENKILQKIRLDWNYNSIAGERNALTFEETKSLILHGISKGNRPLKDYIEMKIHNDTISWMFEIAPLGFALSEDFIKQIHEAILLEPYEVESFDKDGKPVLKMVEIGKYKQTPNRYKGSKRGKIGEFATPEETPKLMKELLDWYSTESQRADVNPVAFAAEFHYRFVKIQPFDDANGRIAKLLTNLILLQFGYPPIVIKQSERNMYHFALQTADTGKLDSFIELIARNVGNSLELYLKGARGESLEEIDELEKDLIELEEKLHRLSSKIVKREKVVLLDIFDKSILPMLNRLMDNYAKFERFYIENKVAINVTSLNNIVAGTPDTITRTAKTIASLRELFLNEPINLNPAILVVHFYKNFNRDGFGDVEYSNKVVIHFDELEYIITEQNGANVHSKLVKKYSEELLPDELEEILSRSAEAHKRFIEEKILGAEMMDETVIELEIAPLKLKTV